MPDIHALETVFDSFAPMQRDPNIRENRLDRMRLLLSHLGNPERSFRTYHIAGSKGKGSTSAYLAALLTGSGRKCGLYLSPHIYTIRERFTLSSQFFPDSLYLDTLSEFLDMVSSFHLPESLGARKPTTFEAYTAYGYMLFRNAGCTDAVIETGLGGRLDATNTIEPEAVLLTPIELEHTDVLGSTIREIAVEKSKIITEGTPVFSSAKDADARAVFMEEAMKMHSPIEFLDDAISGFSSRSSLDGERVRFKLLDNDFSLILRMSSLAMAENAALAILAASRLGLLTERGIQLLERTQLPGRFEKRWIDGTLVIIDGAHTARSMRYTLDTFMEIDEPASSTLIFSAVEGKDVSHMLSMLIPEFGRIIITKPDEWKKSDPEGIFHQARAIAPDKDIEYIPDRNEALGKALGWKRSILIAGSFYLASGMEALR